jgi:hypothetical protein
MASATMNPTAPMPPCCRNGMASGIITPRMATEEANAEAMPPR